MDSPQMYDTHSNQQNGAMSADMKKATGGANNQPPANPNTNNNNNNNLTTLNNNTGTTKQTAALLKQHHLQQQYHQHGELSELNSPEISLDLQNLIDDTQFSEGLFTDLINPAVGAAGKHLQNMHPANRQMQTTASGYPRTTLAYMPQPVHSGAGAYSTPQTATNSDSNSSIGSDTSPSIKEEPVDPQDYRRQNTGGAVLPGAGGYLPGYGSGNPTFTTLTPGGVLHHQHHQFQGLGGGAPGMKGGGRPTNGLHPHHQHQHNSAARKGMKPADKSSDEYRRRRERNNIAVRKSREKAKVRTRETEEKVKLLVKENDRLQKRIELLTEELNVLRSLFSNVGVLPEHLHREINKHLDTFQLQHQQQQQHMTEDRRVLDILQEYGP